MNEIKLPYDKNGIQLQIGDKVKGFGCLVFRDGFQIDRTPVVTANIRRGRLYFGGLSYESFRGDFIIVDKGESK